MVLPTNLVSEWLINYEDMELDFTRGAMGKNMLDGSRGLSFYNYFG